MNGISDKPTPWGVHCIGVDVEVGIIRCTDSTIFLTKEEYMRQLSNPNYKWRCPICGGEAWWDDSNYERIEE